MKTEFMEIGHIRTDGEYRIEVIPRLRDGLAGLEDFGHVVVLWFADTTSHIAVDEWMFDSPYRSCDHQLGIFATRGPIRPNAICSSVVKLLSVDREKGTVTIDWIDADANTPVLDIKPYHPSMDRIREVAMPPWCSHWPLWAEDSGTFDWENEFRF